MTEEAPPNSDEGQKPETLTHKPFNPMATYIYFAVALFSAYAVLYFTGYFGLTVFGLCFMIYLLQETRYVLQSYRSSFLRKASYVNVGHAIFYFILLVINGYSLSQGGDILIFPQWEFLTEWSPIFILLSTFGITNIKMMYEPDR